MAFEVQKACAGGTMDHRHDVDDDQLESHSLPGVNMAGKEAECECDTEDQPSSPPEQKDDKADDSKSDT